MQVKSRSVRSWLINDVCFARGLIRSMLKGEIKRVMHERVFCLLAVRYHKIRVKVFFMSVMIF